MNPAPIVTPMDIRLLSDGWTCCGRLLAQFEALPDNKRPANIVFQLAGAAALLEQTMINMASYADGLDLPTVIPTEPSPTSPALARDLTAPAPAIFSESVKTPLREVVNAS